MDNILKQRLVGAIVLISLAVIFLPMMFSGNGQFTSRFNASIPEQPSYDILAPRKEVEEQSLTVLEKVPLIDPVEVTPPEAEPVPQTKPAADVEQQLSPTPVPHKPVNATVPAQPVAKPVQSEAAKPKVTGWVVQVGSFSKERNAITLRNRLRKKGLASFVVTGKGKNGPIYRVRIGPELTRKQASKILNSVENETKLKGLILAYP